MDKRTILRTLSPGDITRIELGNEVSSHIVTRIDTTQITLDNNWHIRNNGEGYECVELAVAGKEHNIIFVSTDDYYITQEYQIGDIINITTSTISYRLPITALTIDKIEGDDTVIIFVDGKPQILGSDPNTNKVIITKKDILTGIPEMEHLIYFYLDPKSLARLTVATPKILGTKDDKIWKEKVDQDYPGLSQYKPDNITYYQQYKDLYRKKDTSLLESEYNRDLLLNYIKGDRLDLIVHTNAFNLLKWKKSVVINAIYAILQYDRMNIFKNMLKSRLDHDSKMIISDTLLGEYEKYYPYILATIENEDNELRELIAGDAMRYDHPNITMDVINKYDNISLQWISNMALENGYIEILDVLEKRGILPISDSIHFAYMNGKYDALEWCAKRNILPFSVDMEQIIEDDISNALQSLVEGLERGHHPIPSFWVTSVVTYNRMELLEYLYNHNAILSTNDADIALYNGNFDILEFYHRHGVLPTLEALSKEINWNRNNALPEEMNWSRKDVIIWGIEHGIPIKEMDLLYMHDDLLDLVVQYDYEFDNSYFDSLAKRTLKDDYYTQNRLKALKDRGIWK